MAKTEVGLSVDVEFQSIGQMRKAIKEATSDLIAMSEKFGASSAEATAAAKRVAELKDRLGDAKALADTFNPDKKFVALGGALQGATAGFSALQGAMGLFGSESKDLEKMLLKVQSAMALQQGISGIAGAMDSMKMLAGTIKTQVVTAFSTLRGAIIATGLGALAVAVGLVIANFDAFKKAVFNLIPGLESISNFVGGLITKFTDFVGITSEAERNLEKLTKANGRANETIDQQIKLLEAQGGKEDEIYKLKKQRGENELNTLRENLKVKGKLSDEELKQFRDLKNGQQVLDLEEKTRLKKDAEDKQKKLESDAEKTRQKQKEINAKNKEIQDAADKVVDDARRAKLTERQRQEEDVERAFQERKKALLAAGIKDETAIKEQKEIELKAISDKYAEEERKKKEEEDKKAKEDADAKKENEKNFQQELNKIRSDIKLAGIKDERIKEIEQLNTQYAEQRQTILDNENLTEEQKLALLKALKEKQAQELGAIDEKNKKIDLQRTIDVENAKLEAVSQSLGALSNLVGAFAGDNEKNARKIFNIQKALNISQAIVDTYAAANSIFRQAALNPTTVLFPAQPFIAAGVAIAAGLANVAKISQQRFQGGSTGGGGGATPPPALGGGAPVAAALPATATAQMVNAQAINQMGNQAARAYVLNSDIQNNDQRNAYLQRNARLG